MISPYNKIEVITMTDYKEMYLTMIRASEKAINTLVEAQKKCEELYLEGEDEKTEQENH